MASSPQKWRLLWFVIGITFLVTLAAGTKAGREFAGGLLWSLRMQNVQAVNVNFSPFIDASADPTLHQLVTQMISDKVQVQVNEDDKTVPDAASASRIAGFPVLLPGSRRDSPTLVVGGAHKVALTVDRNRLQEIAAEAGHPELVLPQSLDGASLNVEIPRSVHAQYGTCPGPTTATTAITNNITGPNPGTTQYADCVRLREGLAAKVQVPPNMDIANLAEIGLESAGMAPAQPRDFLQDVDWKAILTLNVPRFLRAYQPVTVDGGRGTLLSMGGRRGPGYALIWTKNGVTYSLSGFGDSSRAAAIADSLR